MNDFIDDFEEVPEMAEYEAFRITDDNKAEWAIKKIKENRAERDRLVKVCEEQISEYAMKAQWYIDREKKDSEYFISMLSQYSETVPLKTTKTQSKYSLPSGDLVWRTKPPEYKRAETLVEELEAKGLGAFVKTKKVEDWAELKKLIQIVDGQAMAVTEDGEAIPLEGVTVTPGQTIFEVKA